MQSGGATIVLDGVELGLGDFAVSFDLDLPAGGLTAITGPSGAGKSTLLSLVAGFERPARGRVALGGHDVTRLGPGERPVSMVFQENNLFAHLDVGTNIALGIDPSLKLGKADRERIDDALARVGLDGYARRKPGELSGGERQRVAIARCLVRRRPILLLDEPFAALGPGLKAEMLRLVAALHRETGMSVVMVTHEPADAQAIAQTVVFVKDGRIVADGNARDFFARTDVPGLAAYLGKNDT
ncbi:thiamine ABC transporter ATP-binding protein [Pararhizobium mangrovi]|uniref:Thiamine ABC transporter ATP-binding protein n=1 Tax=Pararhizobium mangrovi TaxID=2590452 RepID=A0A506UCS0_9HYPH|nr:thiamine ABC transporter ATP-binding protein [Pararhizobium mangrovi]TPW30754.1 thiamine ABC transporter ATP-binding protein [Pararhizobium mangrovi]